MYNTSVSRKIESVLWVLLCLACCWHSIFFLLLLQQNGADSGGGSSVRAIRGSTRKTLLNLKRDKMGTHVLQFIIASEEKKREREGGREEKRGGTEARHTQPPEWSFGVGEELKYQDRGVPAL